VATRPGKALTGKAASESGAGTAEMACAEPAANMSAAEAAPDMSAAEPAAHVSAATETAPVSASTAVSAAPPPRASASAVSPPVSAAAVARMIMVLRNIAHSFRRVRSTENMDQPARIARTRSMTRTKRRASFRVVLRPCGINRHRGAEVALTYRHGLSRRRPSFDGRKIDQTEARHVKWSAVR
jgi:hypothetical protein